MKTTTTKATVTTFVTTTMTIATTQSLIESPIVEEFQEYGVSGGDGTTLYTQWNEINDADGYEITYDSVDMDKTYSETEKIFKNYYIRGASMNLVFNNFKVRAFKIIDNKTYYSEWSNAVSAERTGNPDFIIKHDDININSDLLGIISPSYVNFKQIYLIDENGNEYYLNNNNFISCISGEPYFIDLQYDFVINTHSDYDGNYNIFDGFVIHDMPDVNSYKIIISFSVTDVNTNETQYYDDYVLNI